MMANSSSDDTTQTPASKRQKRIQGLSHVHFEVEVANPQHVTRVQEQWVNIITDESLPLPEFTWLQSSTTTSATRTGEINVDQLPDYLRSGCVNVHVDGDSCSDTSITNAIANGTSILDMKAATIHIHTFYLNSDEACVEELDPTSNGGGDDEWTAGCDNLTLPHKTLHGLWENLIYDPSLKRQLLHYASTALLFADRKVSSHVVHWNRILLLHGPPGTGKTSLCRALAHKLSIRLSDRFPRSCLLEIHSHSLFSKWFSTSGKLVSSLFTMIRDMVEDDPSTLVFVLVDEVESLAASRGGGSNGDPADATRAVNSLLTSLDRLRSFPNVLVLTTTNLTRNVDDAFVDRVDLKVHVGYPNLEARLQILKSTIDELRSAGILMDDDDEGQTDENRHSRILDGITQFEEEHKMEDATTIDLMKRYQSCWSPLLLSCAHKADGLSGRALRRLPLQAHSQFLGGVATSISTAEYLRAVESAIEAEQNARKSLRS